MARNQVEFWLKDRHNVYMRLPVNPESIEYSSPFGLNTVNIANLGEVAIPGERGLKQVSFSSFFPRDYNASYCEYDNFPFPWDWVKKIEEWRDDRRNIRLIIVGTPISIPVFVEEFKLEPEKAGAPGDVYYTITLKEYRPIKAKQLVTAANTPKQEQRPKTDKAQPQTHTVAKGDSLFKIAKAVYGDGNQWRKIYEANKSVIGKNPDKIYPGQKLVIA